MYNYWKNQVKSGTQTHKIKITNTNAMKMIQEFLNNHADKNQLLGFKNGTSMIETQVKRVLLIQQRNIN